MRFDVSIVIPCRNERARLATCLDALQAQDLEPSRFEVIVVDGRSHDGTCDLARERGARLVHDGGRGPAAARNIGIEAATGRIIAFTDADCVPRFDWLSRLLAGFESDRQVGGVAGALRLPRRTLIGRLEDNDARVSYRGYITSNMAYRRDVLREAGGFDESLACAEDHDLAWRVLDLGYRIERAPEAIVLHDPPELDTLAGYLRKQFWYARSDVPAHAKALRRAWGSRPSAGALAVRAGATEALQHAAHAAVVGAALLARSPGFALATSSLAAITAAQHVARTTAEVGGGASEVPRMAAVEAVRRLVRGAGTLVGFAELARPAARSRLSAIAPRLRPGDRAEARVAPSPA